VPPRIKVGTPELGVLIRKRRIDLGLSIEEAAGRAKIGVKSWGRYEAGSSIREDKIRGLCKALGWSKLPDSDKSTTSTDITDSPWVEEIDETHEAWSNTLAEKYGRSCALAFAIGYDLLSDHLNEDLGELACEPRGTHLGQLSGSWLNGSLPEQFIPRYDYDFVYALKSSIIFLRTKFTEGNLCAESVLEELALYLIFCEGTSSFDMDQTSADKDDRWQDWLDDILGDLDIDLFLFTPGFILTPRIIYHFDHWMEARFYNENNFTRTEQIAAVLGLLDIQPECNNSDTQ
jgi:transcriptional regulator with XRE-family HTH domain